MRIVYLTAGSGRRECDACLRDSELARALMRRGHDVLLVPLYTPLVEAEARRVAVNHIFYGGINVYLQQKFPLFRRTPRLLDRLLDFPWLLSYVARFGHMTEARELAEMTISVLEGAEGKQRKELDRLANWLAEHARPDIVVLANTLFAGMAGPIRERLGAPVVAMVSGEDAFINEFPEPWRERSLEVLRRRAGELDGLMTGTRWYRDFAADYLRVAPERIDVTGNGIPVRHYPDHPAEPPEPFTIGYRAAIGPATGLETLAEAFILLKRRQATRAARLLVAGYLGPLEKPYLERVEKRLAEAGVASDYEFVGELGPEDRPPYLARLHAFCVPSVYDEPVGMVVPEAAAAAVPVVMPRKGSLPELVQDLGCGIVVDQNTPETMADALAQLAADPAKRQELGQTGRQKVAESMTVDHLATRTIAYLETCLA